MEIKKNEEYIVDVIDNGFEGEGIAKIDNFTIFIDGAIKNEQVKIKILKVNKSFAFAKIIQVLKSSESRQKTDCATYPRCGGCSLRHIKYEDTLKIKRQIVANCIKKALKKDVKISDTMGMEEPVHYRNKLIFPLGYDLNKQPIMGTFAQRSHNIIKTDKCFIQNETLQQIATDIFDYIIKNNISIYDETTKKGLIRNLVLKIGIKTNQIMVILVLTKDSFKQEKEFFEFILDKHPNIKTIIKNINPDNTNVILGKQDIVLYGDGYIQDKIGEFTFNISAQSFYQVNSIQTEVLYNKVLEAADLSGKEIVFDLYCGIGTITTFLAKNAKFVYGIETVEQAIKDANENAKLNNVNNVEYILGDVEEKLPELVASKKIEADLIVVDPPRKGLDNITIETILKVKPKKIVYVSCNPATLARDLVSFENMYEIIQINPVDMFPYTSHVECVAVMCLK